MPPLPSKRRRHCRHNRQYRLSAATAADADSVAAGYAAISLPPAAATLVRRQVAVFATAVTAKIICLYHHHQVSQAQYAFVYANTAITADVRHSQPVSTRRHAFTSDIGIMPSRQPRYSATRTTR